MLFRSRHGPYPIPGKDSERWKKWAKKGYQEAALSELGDLVLDVTPKTEETSSEAVTASEEVTKTDDAE